MKKNKIIFLVLSIFLITVVCGCNNDEQGYKEPIQNYLKGKYGCSFEIYKATKSFNGSDGHYIYALCESEEYEDETFGVYCYQDEEKSGNLITIDDSQYAIYDEYVEVIYSNQLEKKIKDQIGSDVFLQCQVTFSDHFVTEEEYQTGMQECLNNEDLYSHVTVYVISEDNNQLEAVREKVESICLKYNAYRQYLYFAISPNMDISVIQQHYENEEGIFDQHMNECDQIEKVYFSLLHRDEGFTKRSVEKG